LVDNIHSKDIFDKKAKEKEQANKATTKQKKLLQQTVKGSFDACM